MKSIDYDPTLREMRQIIYRLTRGVDAWLVMSNQTKRGRPGFASGDSEVLRIAQGMVHMVGISTHSVPN